MPPGVAARHPYRFVALLEGVVVLVYLLAGTVAHFAGLSTMGLYALANLALAVIVALLLTRMGWWTAVGFRRPDRRSDLWYFAVPLVPAAINLIPGIDVGSLGGHGRDDPGVAETDLVDRVAMEVEIVVSARVGEPCSLGSVEHVQAGCAERLMQEVAGVLGQQGQGLVVEMTGLPAGSSRAGVGVAFCKAGECRRHRVRAVRRAPARSRLRRGPAAAPRWSR